MNDSGKPLKKFLRKPPADYGISDEFYTRRWTSLCTAMYVAVHIWAAFGDYQSLLATLPDLALYFGCMVYSRQIKLQHMFYIYFWVQWTFKLIFEDKIKPSNKTLLLKLESVAVRLLES